MIKNLFFFAKSLTVTNLFSAIFRRRIHNTPTIRFFVLSRKIEVIIGRHLTIVVIKLARFYVFLCMTLGYFGAFFTTTLFIYLSNTLWHLTSICSYSNTGVRKIVRVAYISEARVCNRFPYQIPCNELALEHLLKFWTKLCILWFLWREEECVCVLYNVHTVHAFVCRFCIFAHNVGY